MLFARRRLFQKQSRKKFAARVAALSVAVGGAVALQFASGVGPATAGTSGVWLQPSEGQFVLVGGTQVASLTTNEIKRASTNAISNAVAQDVDYYFNIPTSVVPATASAVAITYLVKGSFPGSLASGDSTATTDTSANYPADTQRTGFDVVKRAANGNVYFKANRFDTGTGGTLSVFTARVHGYYTSATSPDAGSTFVSMTPKLVYDSTTASRPIPSDTLVTVADGINVPADGSAYAAAVQTTVLNPPCNGTFGVYSGTSTTRSDPDGAFQTGDGSNSFDIVPISPAGQIKVRLYANTSCASNVRLRVYLRGYYSLSTFSTPGSSNHMIQQKILDTPAGSGTVLAAGSTGSESSVGCAKDKPIPAGGGCTVQFSLIGAPATGVEGLSAQVIAFGGSATTDGSIVVKASKSDPNSASVHYTDAGRYDNFDMATYSQVDNSSLYVYNSGAAAVDVAIRVEQ